LSDLELILAYNAAIEIWSAALDVREKRDKGYTQRLVEMTLSLAKTMGISGQELVNIRLGVLFHHIGNLAVPERILLKPGELSTKEWVTVHMHSFHILEMLWPIPYLRPATEIP
jgi:response regulator RpfG family c-di-GMP phosphodiesterase